jgi:hypothetical protein
MQTFVGRNFSRGDTIFFICHHIFSLSSDPSLRIKHHNCYDAPTERTYFFVFTGILSLAIKQSQTHWKESTGNYYRRPFSKQSDGQGKYIIFLFCLFFLVIPGRLSSCNFSHLQPWRGCRKQPTILELPCKKWLVGTLLLCLMVLTLQRKKW